MKLQVRLIKQPRKSVDCGIACIAMLLDYYGVEYDYKKLRKDIGVLRWGTSSPQLGSWLLRNGFDVEIVTMHPALFNLFSHFETKEALLKHLRSFRGKIKPRLNVIVLEHFIEFVQAGGKVTPRVPTVDDIKKELSAKRPLISLLTHWFLHDSGMKPRFTFHFNVITGIDPKFIYVNDPDWGDELGGQHKHEIGNYLYAMYASAYGALDNASLMIVKKRSINSPKPALVRSYAPIASHFGI